MWVDRVEVRILDSRTFECEWIERKAKRRSAKVIVVGHWLVSERRRQVGMDGGLVCLGWVDAMITLRRVGHDLW